jgi:hypothetical protein
VNLTDLVEKLPDADLMCEMIPFAAERLIELEAGDIAAAAYGEKKPKLRAQLNVRWDVSITPSPVLRFMSTWTK